jgi:hypothetical protein
MAFFRLSNICDQSKNVHLTFKGYASPAVPLNHGGIVDTERLRVNVPVRLAGTWHLDSQGTS